MQTPLTLSLKEWCTRPSSATSQCYQLFAVIMHSGVTISSGHYTAYVRMSDMKDVKLWQRDGDQAEEDEESKPGMPIKDEPVEYDDGEVSFSLNSRKGTSLASNKTGGKKLPEGGIGLLGGQRSLSNCELGNNNNSGGGVSSEGPKRRKTINTVGQNPETGLKRELEAGEEAAAAAALASCAEVGATEQQALTNLLHYEGKWLLFDDCEVRLFEEEDFLRACSPETCSSSTPYLLFYRKMPEPGP